jgi:hypothetical protein
MNDESLPDLKHALLLLALPVTFQMHLDVGSQCRVAALARSYATREETALVAAGARLSPRQKDILTGLDVTLTCLCGEGELAHCSDTALRRHAGWRSVRRRARQALLAFGWMLELPPRDAPIYNELSGRHSLLI